MNLLERIRDAWRDRRHRDPTVKWLRDEAFEVTVDLYRGLLCGVGIGEPIKGLRPLGPASDFTCMGICWNDGDKCIDGPTTLHCRYYDRGVGFAASENLKLDSFSLTLRATDVWSEYSPYKSKIMLDGVEIPVSEMANRRRVDLHLGTPRFVDDNPRFTAQSAHYDVDLLYFQIDFDEKGRTDHINISRPEWLAKEKISVPPT